MADTRANARLEMFCDGVFAIALTLLIIDIRLPITESYESTGDVWRALARLAPSIFAFVLSFGVILITWVNHHGVFELVDKSSASFIYANGFLLLTVVFMPFPTALLGEFILTDHAAPAVVLYNAVAAAQALGWVLLTGVALRDRLGADEQAMATIRTNGRHGYFAIGLYSMFAVVALWLPLAVAMVTALTWVFWLVLSVRMKQV